MTIISIPATNNIADPEVRRVLEALRIAVETLAGNQGLVTDQAVTKGELNHIGLIGLKGSSIYNPASKAAIQQANKPAIPPIPLNVSVRLTTSNLAIITWTVPSFADDIDHAEIWQVTITAFSSKNDYSKGDVVSYLGGYYRFITDHTAGNWAAADVVAVTSSSFTPSDADTVTESASKKAVLLLDTNGAAFFWVRLISAQNVAGPFQTLAATVAASAGNVPTEHNSLIGLQGGTTDQYYHLNAAASALFTSGSHHQLLHGSASLPTWGAVDLSADISGNLPVTNLNGGASASNVTYWRGDGVWEVPPGTGVRTITIASANGVAGNSSGGADPILTLSTTANGILKGNNAAITTATDGSDYLSPSSGVTLSQTTSQSIGSNGNRLSKLWTTDLNCSNTISGNINGSSASCTGNAATATTASACSGNSATVTGLSITTGKTLTANNSLTLKGTDSTTMTFPSSNATIARTDSGQVFSGTNYLTGTVGLGYSSTGAKQVFIGNQSIGDDSSTNIYFCASNVNYNWRLVTNGWNAGQFELLSSATAGGIDFTNPPVLHLDHNGALTILGGLTVKSPTLITTSTAFTNGAGANTGTLTNAPASGNPTKWIPMNDNGTTRYLPAW